MAVASSMIRYKMPWLPMSWLALLALPAARGVSVLARVLADEVHRRCPPGAAAIVALVPALFITARSSFLRPAHKIEQLAYVHTAPDYNRWFPLVEAGAVRVGHDRIVVAVAHDATWPLPYVLKPYKRTKWGADGKEDVIIASVPRGQQLEPKLTGTYYRGFYELRDSAKPAYIYLRASVYEGLLGAERGHFKLVGPRVLPAAAKRGPIAAR
jgi:hypothetical protein